MLAYEEVCKQTNLKYLYITIMVPSSFHGSLRESVLNTVTALNDSLNESDSKG